MAWGLRVTVGVYGLTPLVVDIQEVYLFSGGQHTVMHDIAATSLFCVWDVEFVDVHGFLKLCGKGSTLKG